MHPDDVNYVTRAEAGPKTQAQEGDARPYDRHNRGEPHAGAGADRLALRINDDAQEPLLCLLLEGAGWGDFFAEALPSIIGRGCDLEYLAQRLLLLVERGTGRVIAGSADRFPFGCDSSVIFSTTGDDDSCNVEAVRVRSARCGSGFTAEKLSTQMSALICREAPLEDPLEQMMRSFNGGDLIIPDAAAILSTVQPALDWLADFLRPRWTPQTHHLFPPSAREHVRMLLMVGQALGRSWTHAFRDAWLSGVIPHVLCDLKVHREATLPADVEPE